MRTSSVLIAESTVVDVSKLVLQELLCDFPSCSAALSCWDKLREHQVRHCQKGHFHGASEYQCKKCHALLQSKAAAEEHIVSTHFWTLKFPCLARSCPESFLKPTLVFPHIQDAHPEMVGKTFELPSHKIQPLWQPVYTRPEIPPPLPFERLPYGTVATGIIFPCRTRSRLKTPPSSPPVIARVPGTPSQARRSKATRPPAASKLSQEQPDEVSRFTFDDLDHASDERELVDGMDFVTWVPPASMLKDHSRPPPMPDTPPKDDQPPVSIHYNVFRQRVLQLEKDGVLDFSKDSDSAALPLPFSTPAPGRKPPKPISSA